MPRVECVGAGRIDERDVAKPWRRHIHRHYAAAAAAASSGVRAVTTAKVRNNHVRRSSVMASVVGNTPTLQCDEPSSALSSELLPALNSAPTVQRRKTELEMLSRSTAV